MVFVINISFLVPKRKWHFIISIKVMEFLNKKPLDILYCSWRVYLLEDK